MLWAGICIRRLAKYTRCLWHGRRSMYGRLPVPRRYTLSGKVIIDSDGIILRFSGEHSFMCLNDQCKTIYDADFYGSR